MTNTSDRACAHESDPVALLDAEWRRTGMPSVLERAVDGSVSVPIGPRVRVWITSPLAMAAVLQHLPTAKAADEYAVAIVRRVLHGREGHEYPECAAVLDVLWPRVMLALRKEFLAARLFVGARDERIKLDGYVAALEAMMRTPEPGDSAREIGDDAAKTGRAGADVQLVSPEIGEQIALLCYAEWIRREAGPATVEFWDLVCDEVANELRAALVDIEQGRVRRRPPIGDPDYIPARLALSRDAELIRARSGPATVSIWDLVFQELMGLVRTALADVEQEGRRPQVSLVGEQPGGGIPSGPWGEVPRG